MHTLVSGGESACAVVLPPNVTPTGLPMTARDGAFVAPEVEQTNGDMGGDTGRAEHDERI